MSQVVKMRAAGAIGACLRILDHRQHLGEVVAVILVRRAEIWQITRHESEAIAEEPQQMTPRKPVAMLRLVGEHPLFALHLREDRFGVWRSQNKQMSAA